jgi:CRP-like cAMP-binding protein
MAQPTKDDRLPPRELLGLIAFFNETLDAKQLDALAAGARRRSFAPNDVLVAEDSPGGSMFVVELGEVVVTVKDKAGPVAKLYVGDIVGEASLLTGQPRSATVTASEPVLAIEIDKAALAPILADAPALVDRFAEMLEKRAAELAKIHGGAAWGMVTPGDAEVHHLIRAFYGAE